MRRAASALVFFCATLWFCLPVMAVGLRSASRPVVDTAVNTLVEAVIEDVPVIPAESLPAGQAGIFALEPEINPLGFRLPFETGILVNLPAFTLSFVQGGTVVRQYPVAIGRLEAPSPTGSFSVRTKVVDPVWLPPASWYPPEKRIPVPPGPDNPLGRRWIGFGSGYGVHGNNNPASIGKAASLGCLRLPNQAIEELFELVTIGMPVKIIYETAEVRWDPATGVSWLHLYPDIYGRDGDRQGKVAGLLARAAGGYRLLPEEQARLLEAARVKPVHYPLEFEVKVNGRFLGRKAFMGPGTVMVPLRVLAESLGAEVNWDPFRRVALLEGSEINGRLWQGSTFVPVPELESRLGIMVSITPAEREVEVNALPVWHNGRLLTRRAFLREGLAMVAREALEQVFGVRLTWVEDRKVYLVNGLEVPVWEVAGDHFLPLRITAEALGGRVIWNASKRRAEVYTGNAGYDD